MVLLIVAILTASVILLIFKVSQKFNANNLHIITISYFIAACLGTILSANGGESINYFNYNWFWWSVIYGAYFMLGFLLFGYSTQKSGLVTTGISSRVSLIIPVILGFILFGEKTSISLIIGLATAIVSLGLIMIPNRMSANNNNNNNKSTIILLLPLFVFLGIGINDTMIKCAQYYLIKGNGYSQFIASSFYFSSIVGLLIVLFRKKTKLSFSSLLLGLILGILNFFNFKCLLSGLAIMDVTKFIPTYNVGVVVITSLTGIIIFKEKLQLINITGIILSIIAIILITI